MQCTNCLCTASQEVSVGPVKYHECDWCGNLMPTEQAVGVDDQKNELKVLRQKLKEANAIIDTLVNSSL
jgi:ribosomal protein S26